MSTKRRVTLRGIKTMDQGMSTAAAFKGTKRRVTLRGIKTQDLAPTEGTYNQYEEAGDPERD